MNFSLSGVQLCYPCGFQNKAQFVRNAAGFSQEKKNSSPHSAGMGHQLCLPGSCKQANFCLLTALVVAIPAVNSNQKQAVREATDNDGLLLI